MRVIVWRFLAFFHGVGKEKYCLAFFKTSGSVTAVSLELYNFFPDFQRSSIFCHGPILENTSGFAV